MEILKKIPQKQIKLIIVLVTLVIIVFSYFFGYRKYDNKAEIINKENRLLISSKNELKEKHKKKDALVENIKEMKERIMLIDNEFPSGLAQDKSIMFIHNLSNYAEMNIKLISLNDNKLFYPATGFEVSDNGGLKGYKTSVTISYASTYEGFKKCIDYISNYKDRMNIPNFNAAFDNTSGNLSGTMTIDMYALSGMDKKFEETIIEGVLIGTDNIFGTFENPMNNEQLVDQAKQLKE